MQQDERTTETEEVRTTGHLGLKIAALLLLGILGVTLFAMAVGSRQISEDPAELVQQLGSDDAEIVRRATEELVKTPRTAMEPLREAVKPGNPQALRVTAIKVLTQIRTTAALQVIGQYVVDEEAAVQTEAIKAVGLLAFLDRKGATDRLKEALELDKLAVIEAAAKGLQEMAFSGATKVLRDAVESGEGPQAVVAARFLYQEEPSEETARFIVESLASDNPAVAEAATSSVKALGAAVMPQLVAADTPAATKTETEVRDQIIGELKKTLDASKAANWLAALGHVADDTSLEQMISDFQNTRNESSWRLAASDAMAEAARRNRSLEPRVVQVLQAMLDNENETDDRIKIGAAIALCRLGKREGVTHLLERLADFQEDIAVATDPAKIQDLAALRIRAQQALTEAGGYADSRQMVVDALMAQARGMEDDMEEVWSGGHIVLWVAAETLGELRVTEMLPSLRKYLTARTRPDVVLAEDGSLTNASGGPASVTLEDWQAPTDEAVDEQVKRMRTFLYPASVRLSAAIALGKMGDTATLTEAFEAEQEILNRLERNRNEQPEYYQRAAVIEAVEKKHRDVFFYIRTALNKSNIAER